MPTFCLKCGTQAVDEKSLYCNICGAKLIHPTPETSENPPRSKEVSILSKTDAVSRSQKSESKKLKSKNPFKRKSMILPAILIFIAFVLVIIAISQTGIINPISSNESVIPSQDRSVIPVFGTPIPPSPMTTGAPTTTMENDQVISTQMPTPTLTQTPAIPITTTTTTVAQTGIKNIMDTAEADGRFTTFVTAVKAAGLNDTIGGDTLNGPEMFTVFAPTDDAFKKLSEASIDSLLKDPQGDLLQILLYHVVQGKVTAADLKKFSSIETLQGGSLPISVSNGIVSVDGANVIIPDIECSNGLIQGVDTVMLPPA